MITNDPIEAIMKALDSGVRTQSMADMAEAGCKVQTSGNRGAGAGHNADYAPVWAHLQHLSWERHAQAALIWSLFSLEESDANEWIDECREDLLARFIPRVPAWEKLTKMKRERAEWIAYAALASRRADLDCVRPEWGPLEVSYHLADKHGVSVSTKHWKRDYSGFWNVALICVQEMETEALDPVRAIIRQQNHYERQEMQMAA